MNILEVLESQSQLYNKHVAVAIGLDEAIVIHQIHYWLKKSKHYKDGRHWTYNTIKEWQAENFPFWCYRKMKYLLRSLEKKGILIAKNYNPIPSNKTKWYTINYELLSSLVSIFIEKEIIPKEETPVNPLGQDLPQGIKDHSIYPPVNPLGQDLPQRTGLGQDLPIAGAGFAPSITETSSETSAAEISEGRECERRDTDSPPTRKYVPGDRSSTASLVASVRKQAAEISAALSKELEAKRTRRFQ